ncbi:MAG: cryptochrome/photolyase family protein [Salibacteraceae bacterium]
MDSSQKTNIFWFRRDFRLEDNTALHEALKMDLPVKPIFIFDSNIINELDPNDSRISFIHEKLNELNRALKPYNSGITVFVGDPIEVWKSIIATHSVHSVFYNKDYEPYARKRDKELQQFFATENIECHSYKDHVIFEESEILKNDGTPYTVFTPFKKKWLENFKGVTINKQSNLNNFINQSTEIPSLQRLGFQKSAIQVKAVNLSQLNNYSDIRDFPAINGTSNLSPHLRFGTVSIRQMVSIALKKSPVFLSELIWREFFMQILWHYPQVQNNNFKRKYDGIEWRNNTQEFELWCQGKTGYPMVDAGMRELVQTGYMHNRVRMITAGFLCKHLLIDWKWGEAFFAKHLLDFELASNNGNWQWASGTGCDSAPYFRIFNPTTQLQKFDKHLEYVQKWIPDYNMGLYQPPMVNHKIARERALEAYKKGIIQ